MSTERYLNLVGGHFPFFHSICFRVTTFAFICIYLDLKTDIALFLIWLSNIIIGCVIVGKQKITQVCLNSFLSILVPSCIVFADTAGLTDKQRTDQEKVKREEKSFLQKVSSFNNYFAALPSCGLLLLLFTTTVSQILSSTSFAA